MNLDQFITNETGKKHLIPGQSEVYRGQCVQLIGIYLTDVFGETLPTHPNAKDYWTYGIPGWSKTSTPSKGDIAVYDGHGDFPEGHIAIYVDGVVFEENADPDGSPAHLSTRSHTYLLGYLTKEGDDMLTPQQIKAIWLLSYFLDLGDRGTYSEDQEKKIIADYQAAGLDKLLGDLANGDQRAKVVAQYLAGANTAAQVLKPGTYKVN